MYTVKRSSDLPPAAESLIRCHAGARLQSLRVVPAYLPMHALDPLGKLVAVCRVLGAINCPLVIDDHSERARLWDLADRVFPPYAVHRERAGRTGRTIPIVQLTPR